MRSPLRSLWISSRSGCRLFLAIAALLIFSHVPTQAQLLITVGPHVLQPNTSGQSVELFLENPTLAPISFAALNFNLQVADGATPTPAPNITDVDILTGTLFASNNNGQVDAASLVHAWAATTATSSGSVTLAAGASRTLATIQISTLGYDSGSWNFNVGNTFNGATAFADASAQTVPVTIVDGTISVVPEPASALAVSGVMLGFAVLLRCRKRAP